MLTVSFPSASSWWDTYEEHGAECYDLSALDSLLDTLRTDLFFFPVDVSVRNQICENLVDLRLELPTTRTFGTLFPHVDTITTTPRSAARPRSLFPKLRSLFITITDATGPAGSWEYASYEYGYNDMDLSAVDGDMADPYYSGFPPSNLQLRDGRNRDHQRDLWRFVASCRSINALYVEATQALRLDELWEVVDEEEQKRGFLRAEHGEHDWTRSGLATLGLCRIDTSVQALLRMIQPNYKAVQDDTKQISPVRRINLDRVKLVPDNTVSDNPGAEKCAWATLYSFLHPERCPALDFLGICYLSYFSTHPDFTYAHRLSEDWASMWTTSDEDWDALSGLFQANPRLAVQGLADRWCLASEVLEVRDL
ncbi:uncharacterized protein B0I36DRAFT_331600 [Microdochium trichocladiopsis]|uniref:Uncharacterized protein n=1 Tax=Microdochium trichocladiopsis TaxID=1682393 RepID=A0A9P8XWI6_9PEZI|nr:uncharacterized protein B0I36DRAFT_331600 [Microdochium trichocladiopsis]KAH7024539.1 hypothetical protein B0I36DRAFT_331600 [Microdochium trichocladiopsis]